MAIALAEAGADILLVQVYTLCPVSRIITDKVVLTARRVKPIDKRSHPETRPQSRNLHRRPRIPRLRFCPGQESSLRRLPNPHLAQLRRHPKTTPITPIPRQRLG